jgi:nicotinamide phosphoribosyltransferase
MIMKSNIILATDSYKPSHYRQYPPGTEGIFSFFESCGGRFEESLFFGLQYIVSRHLAGAVVTEEAIEEACEVFAVHYGDPSLFNEVGWRYILREHGGRLPVRLRAVPEGLRVPVSNVLMTLENTDPNVAWLVNYLETILVQLWYPVTVATQSSAMRAIIRRYLEETGDVSLIDFKLHDFGYRGSTSDESAAIGGAAHLVNFLGTDTLVAIRLLREYYDEPMAGFSIPAAEHSTITSWGKENEVEAYRNMLRSFPKGLVAVVSDSYDIYRACRELWGSALRDEVLSRDGTLVIRPDSGEPRKVVVDVLGILGERFGFSVNDKGYKALDPHVRLIQGDGITFDSLGGILEALREAGWSADNIAFGSGGGLLQKVDRDMMKFAFKASAICRGGVWSDVMKDPVTDPGKQSKAGRLALVRRNGTFATVREENAGVNENLLETVFENGEVRRRQSLADIRARAFPR